MHSRAGPIIIAFVFRPACHQKRLIFTNRKINLHRAAKNIDLNTDIKIFLIKIKNSGLSNVIITLNTAKNNGDL